MKEKKFLSITIKDMKAFRIRCANCDAVTEVGLEYLDKAFADGCPVCKENVQSDAVAMLGKSLWNLLNSTRLGIEFIVAESTQE